MVTKLKTRKPRGKKSLKNKTSKIRDSKTDKIWGNYGKVLNIKTNKYVRIGSYASIKAIGELKRDAEWEKRVNYITSRNPFFGKRLTRYLEKNE